MVRVDAAETEQGLRLKALISAASKEIINRAAAYVQAVVEPLYVQVIV